MPKAKMPRHWGLDEKTLRRRCSVCGGNGSLHIDMGFLPNVHTPCEACKGTGYMPEAWEVRLHDVALPELFEMTLDEIYTLFSYEDKLARPLQATHDVGLGYLVLRQPGYALSGGEAQRLKIAKELCRRTRSDTLYILDEPTVGQHLDIFRFQLCLEPKNILRTCGYSKHPPGENSVLFTPQAVHNLPNI